MDIYQEKVSIAQDILDGLIVEKGKKRKKGIKVKSIEEILKKAKYTTDEQLCNLTLNDISKLGIPRHLCSHFRHVFNGQYGMMRGHVISLTYTEMLKFYDPYYHHNIALTNHLKKISGNKRFIKFNEDLRVDYTKSARQLSKLIDTDEEFPDSKSVGEKPDNIIAINFMFPELELDNYKCTITGYNHRTIPSEIKLILHLAIKNGEIECDDKKDAENIIRILDSQDPLSKVQSLFSKSAIELHKLFNLGKAPLLYRKIS